MLQYYNKNMDCHLTQTKKILGFPEEVTLKLKAERQQSVYVFGVGEFGKGFSGRAGAGATIQRLGGLKELKEQGVGCLM